jgi:hypothetical protein
LIDLQQKEEQALSMISDPTRKKDMKRHNNIERRTPSSMREHATMDQRFQGFNEKPCPTRNRIR